jgi:hypothetical protein
MRQRVGLVVVSSIVCVVIASPPPRSASPAPKKSRARRRPRREPTASAGCLVITEIMYDRSPARRRCADRVGRNRNRGAQPANLKGLQITSGTKGKIHDPKQRFVCPRR